MFQFRRKKNPSSQKSPPDFNTPNGACTFSISSMAMAHEGGGSDQVATRPAIVVSWDMAGLDGSMVSIWHHVFLSASLQKAANSKTTKVQPKNY